MKSYKSHKVASEFLVKGDKFLAEEKCSEALESYNNCLRFATSDSVESSHAFAARAKLFYRAKLFRECYENIQLARNNANIIDEVFDHDLLDIEEQIKSSSSSLVESANDKWQFFKLSCEANHKIPFIVNCLEVRQNDVYGRFIATTRDLSPGDIVVVEEPFYKILSPLEKHRRCSICLKQNSLNLLPCATCSTGNFKCIFRVSISSYYALTQIILKLVRFISSSRRSRGINVTLSFVYLKNAFTLSFN